MSVRQNLGDFTSIVCFKHIILGVEDVLGTDGAGTVLVRAGRIRGEKVAHEAGLTGTNPDTSTMAHTLDKFLGANGTRLCQVTDVQKDGDDFVVTTQETVCSAGEAPGSSRTCTYTLGAVQGFLEAITGKQLQGSHVECVLRGGKGDIFRFKPLG
jgi:predicted hydrocarbon binding protein